MPEESGSIPHEFRKKKREKSGDFRQDAQIRKNKGEPYKTVTHFAPGKKAPPEKVGYFILFCPHNI